jgi:integrase
VRLALRLQLLTGQRVGEVVRARWTDVDLAQGGEGAVWTIPGDHAKNRNPQRVPLSPEAVAVLAEARRIRPGQGFVFPSPLGDRPMVETAVNKAIHRNLQHFGVAEFTSHDVRRTVATHVAEAGAGREVLRRLLNHVDRSVTAIYDRYSYAKELREALYAWGRRVAQWETGGALDVQPRRA